MAAAAPRPGWRRRLAALAASGDGSRTTRLRLASGLVLMAYTATHLLNHALGLVSLEALEQGRRIFGLIWLHGPSQALLIGSFLVHAILGLASLWRRASWRMPFWEAAQLGLGLAIPVLGTLHVLGTMVIEKCCGVHVSYTFVLAGLWPDLALWQIAFVVVVWLHGCLGVHYWLRLRPGYQHARAWVLATAVLLPVVSILGFVDGGRALIARAAADPSWLPALAAADRWPSPEVVAWVYMAERRLVRGFLLLLLALLAARGLRTLAARRRSRIRLGYDGGRKVTLRKGMSVLEASRMHQIPHPSVCGGRGRCSTCRVRVTKGLEAQPPPSAEERRVLERIGAEADVRLACQLRPRADLAVAVLMAAGAGEADVLRKMDPSQGSEREIAVLFADLRDFTRLSETRLPYDVVFLLNRYFTVMGAAIEGEGGHVDKFVGDGIMALFGLDSGPAHGARQALAAAAAMSEALAALNEELAHELKAPLRMGIGIHAGPTIVGELGYRRAVSLTAIGDTVNIASRLETLTKELAAQLVVSEHLVELAAVEPAGGRRAEVDVRGRRGRLPVRAFADARQAWPEAQRSASSASGWRGALLRLVGGTR